MANSELKRLDVIGVGDTCLDIAVNVDRIPRRDEKIRGRLVGKNPGGVVGNTYSYASLSHLLGFYWGHHPNMDEPRIPAQACTGSEIPRPDFVCGRCGLTVARQRD